MARIRVFSCSANPLTDKPSFCSKSIAAILIRRAAAVLIASRTIQMLAEVPMAPIKLSQEQARKSNYDYAANRPPIGYVEEGPAKLMFGQMWEKRESVGFEILQLCPPHARACKPGQYPEDDIRRTA